MVDHPRRNASDPANLDVVDPSRTECGALPALSLSKGLP